MKYLCMYVMFWVLYIYSTYAESVETPSHFIMIIVFFLLFIGYDIDDIKKNMRGVKQ